MTTVHDRALGSLLGSFVGDAFGAQTEFKMGKQVQKQFPQGIRDMDQNPRFIGEAGEVTDDSEMAIMMIESVLQHGTYSKQAVLNAYRKWRDAGPLDIGITIFGALDERFNPSSQANGALMRIAPLGILGSKLSIPDLMHLSDLDCSVTHVNPVCRDCNRLTAFALSLAISKGWTIHEVYAYLLEAAPSYVTRPEVLTALKAAAAEPPEGIDGNLRGWVLVAFQLAFYTLLNASSFEEGMIDVIMRGGDADTNAAIYGALAGAFVSKAGIPERWVKQLKLSSCLKRLIGQPYKTLPDLAETWVSELLEIPAFPRFS
ncbi:ADP-ribosylglycohydrolase family protein [Sphaerochaeta sp.]|uniref:ADP-ribosylglycohydrolase family protein n=1 Tax=Sphaerochaeta sp. TaxID=1972642 RepID=UPI002FC84077